MNNSFADFKCKTVIKSNLPITKKKTKKTVMSSHMIFYRNFLLSNLILLWRKKKGLFIATGYDFVL